MDEGGVGSSSVAIAQKRRITDNNVAIKNDGKKKKKKRRKKDEKKKANTNLLHIRIQLLLRINLLHQLLELPLTQQSHAALIKLKGRRLDERGRAHHLVPRRVHPARERGSGRRHGNRLRWHDGKALWDGCVGALTGAAARGEGGVVARGEGGVCCCCGGGD